MAVLAALALLAATTFMTPVSNDAGAYLAVADAILAGKLPYRDLFDHKPPGIYYLFAAVLAAPNARCWPCRSSRCWRWCSWPG